MAFSLVDARRLFSFISLVSLMDVFSEFLLFDKYVSELDDIIGLV